MTSTDLPEVSAADLLHLPQCHPLAVLGGSERIKASRDHFRLHLAPGMDLQRLEISPWVGLYAWKTLELDSERLGMETARIECVMACGPDPSETDADSTLVRSRCLERVVREARASGVKYLCMRTDAGDVGLVHLLEERGFRLVDGILTFARRLDPDCAEPPGFDWRMARAEDVPRLREIAADIYRHDRFHVDQAIDACAADRFYAEWLENSVLRGAADFVVVHEQDGRVDSFVTCRIDGSLAPWLGGPHAVIVLVGTAREAEGKGTGRLLNQVALAEMGRRGVSWAQVGTQVSNIRAGRLYEQCGFRLVASSLTLRMLL